MTSCTIDPGALQMATGFTSHRPTVHSVHAGHAEFTPNPGHALADEVVSIFRAFDMWELLTEAEPVGTSTSTMCATTPSCCMSVYEC